MNIQGWIILFYFISFLTTGSILGPVEYSASLASAHQMPTPSPRHAHTKLRQQKQKLSLELAEGTWGSKAFPGQELLSHTKAQDAPRPPRVEPR